MLPETSRFLWIALALTWRDSLVPRQPRGKLLRGLPCFDACQQIRKGFKAVSRRLHFAIALLGQSTEQELVLTTC